MAKCRSSWSITKTDHDRRIVWITDENGPVSVTNDAEAICLVLGGRNDKPYRILYKDSTGRWDELIHERGVFKDFAPIDPELVP